MSDHEELQLHEDEGSPPSAFSKRVIFRVIYYGHSIATVVCDLLGILVGMLLFFYPHKFRETTIYRQFLQHYDRTQAYHYQLFYNISCFGWISLFFLHILAIGGAILGVQLQKPWIMLPQLILLLLRIGLLLAIFCALVTINITGDQLMLKSAVLTLFFLLFAISFLVATVFCFRYVLEKYLIVQRILASTRTVHFKKKVKDKRKK